MENVQQFPDVIEDEWNLQTKEDRRKKLYSVASLILTKFVDLSTSETTDVGNGSRDNVHEYAKEIISLGLLYMEYQEEGNGDCVFNCWKYLMIIFQAMGRKHYALEAFTLLAQYEWFLPLRQSKQLKFSRFVNFHGWPGCNVSCHLYMEHLNKMVKSCVQHLGANKTGMSIQHIGKCIGQLDEILSCYDKDNKVSIPSIHHSIPPSISDRDHIVKQLLESQIFSIKPGRQHIYFPNFSSNVMKKVTKKMTDWMETQISQN